MSNLHLFSAPLLLVILAIATWDDLLEHRIPNTVVVWGIALALSISGLAGGFAGVLAALGGLAVGGALLLPFHLLGGMAAGDVKLMAAAGAFLGPGATVLAVFVALAAGAVLGLAVLTLWWLMNSGTGLFATAHLRRFTPGFLQRMAFGKRPAHVPYAIAIATGSMVSLWTAGS